VVCRWAERAGLVSGEWCCWYNEGRKEEQVVNIAREMEAQLPKELVGLMRAAGEVAADLGESLYLVGGAVRDVLLARLTLDIDLVLEGDAPSLARRLSRLREGKVTAHPRFGTATFAAGEISVDLATARSETYAEPGALPRVKPGTIKNDLFRRDFTINAMAARLDPGRFGEVTDPYGGKIDLDQGVIRVLHGRSFCDDPTRIWRAIRYEQRLGFSLDADTERLLRRDLLFVDRVSGDRIRHELERILKEEQPEKAMRRAEELGALRKLSPGLKGNGWLTGRFEAARRAETDFRERGMIYLALLGWRLTESQLEAFIERLRFGGEAARVLRDISGLKKVLPSVEAEGLRPSEICRLLERHRPGAVTAAAIASDSGLVRQRIELYLSRLRFVAPSMNGDDLESMGVPSGRKLGSLLKTLKDARLDGRVKTRRGEEALVRRLLAESKPEGGRHGR
jgi:tRNA nucleotidyltransferase (CCA-adding enzyme)